MLKVRGVTWEDKSRVLEISAKIWDDDDYIPEVFDDWVHDETSFFAAVLQNNYLVGFGRMCDLGWGNFWLEGLRKDPDSEVSGIGKAISDYMFTLLRNRKITSLRFSTYFDNKASIKINEKRGFKRILTLSLKMRELKTVSNNIVPDFTNIETNPNLDMLMNYLENSSYLKKSKRFITKGWVVFPFNRVLIEQFIKENRVTVYMEDNEIKGAIIATDTHYIQEWWISFLEGENRQIISTLLNYADFQAAQKNKKELLVLLPDKCLQKQVCLDDGFTSWERESDFLLYELPLELL